MKALLNLELFGEDTRQLLKCCRSIFESCGGDPGRAYFDESIGMLPRSSWVAEITGPDEKYGLARSFLRGKTDYSKSNSKGSRGIFCEYILEPGKIYEVKSQVSWKNADRYFCIVNGNGDIVEIDEKEVCHGFGALTFEERKKRKRTMIAEITGPDSQYFFKRIFLNCNLKYCKEDENDPYPGYKLLKERVYEVTESLKKGRKNRYYCLIDEYGNIVRLNEDEACRAVGALTREERREKRIAERISGNQCT